MMPPIASGIVNDVKDFFTNPQAIAKQNQLHRYLARRYGDHPALFGWKLWSEVDLTSGRREDRPAWHQQAAKCFSTMTHISAWPPRTGVVPGAR